MACRRNLQPSRKNTCSDRRRSTVRRRPGQSTDFLSLGAGITVLTVFWGDQNAEATPCDSGALKVTGHRSPLGSVVAFVCSVGDHLWPLGRDCTVVRVGLRRFCFSLPRLLLGVTLPEECPADVLESFGHLMSVSCTYENRAGNTDDDHFDCTQDPSRRPGLLSEKDFWTSAYTGVAEAIAAITGDAVALLPKRLLTEPAASPGELRRKEKEMKARAASFSGRTALLRTLILDDIMNRGIFRFEAAGDARGSTTPTSDTVRMVTHLVDLFDEIRDELFNGVLLDVINRLFPPATPNPFWAWATSRGSTRP